MYVYMKYSSRKIPVLSVLPSARHAMVFMQSSTMTNCVIVKYAFGGGSKMIVNSTIFKKMKTLNG